MAGGGFALGAHIRRQGFPMSIKITIEPPSAADMGVIHGVLADTYWSPGVPRVISLAFWGGIWGIVFALIEGRIPRGAQYWVYALLFGAIFPTLVAWFVVAPLKAQPVAGGWQASRMLTGLLINGAWGLGTALFLALGMKMTRGSRAA